MFKIILAILLFMVIVVFHEFGHFLLAKLNGVCVEEFAIGIGPTLVGKRIGETVYGIKAFPLGGCCVMKGEDGDDDSEGSLNSKGPWARFSIIFAGPFFNFILAFLFGIILVGMDGAQLPVISNVIEDSGAYEAGLRAGDEIVRINNTNIHTFGEITMYNYFHADQARVDVTYRRDGNLHTARVTRRKDAQTGMYLLGIQGGKAVKQGFLGTFKYGWYEMTYQIKLVMNSLRFLFTGRASLNDLSGPVGIVEVIGESYEQSIIYGIRTAFLTMLSFATMLSANLGVMNLLPIPALDGGRIFFILLEIIRRKKIPPEREGMVHLIGLVLLLALMMIVMGNDIRKIFFS